MADLFLGLIHYPVYNKNMEIIATSVANMDIHDIARCAATYDIKRFFIINPLEIQHKIVGELIEYWQIGFGSQYNPDRREALARVEVVHDIETALANIREGYGKKVKIIATDARDFSDSIDYPCMREILKTDNETNYLLLFGTGWGIDADIINGADYRLEPLKGGSNYNHLSVRSAVAIILDRLKGL